MSVTFTAEGMPATTDADAFGGKHDVNMSNRNAALVCESLAIDLSAMVREVNKGLMVQWINQELLNRASHDVRKSIVLYDADHTFVHALSEVPNDGLLQRLYDETPVRYWSVGV